GAAARATASEGPGTSSACWTPLISAISLATWAALPTSVWMRMYAVTTSNDLLEFCRRRNGAPTAAPGSKGLRMLHAAQRCAKSGQEPGRPGISRERKARYACLPGLGARWRVGSGGLSDGRQLGRCSAE